MNLPSTNISFPTTGISTPDSRNPLIRRWREENNRARSSTRRDSSCEGIETGQRSRDTSRKNAPGMRVVFGRMGGRDDRASVARRGLARIVKGRKKTEGQGVGLCRRYTRKCINASVDGDEYGFHGFHHDKPTPIALPADRFTPATSPKYSTAWWLATARTYGVNEERRSWLIICLSVYGLNSGHVDAGY